MELKLDRKSKKGWFGGTSFTLNAHLHLEPEEKALWEKYRLLKEKIIPETRENASYILAQIPFKYLLNGYNFYPGSTGELERMEADITHSVGFQKKWLAKQEASVSSSKIIGFDDEDGPKVIGRE